MKQYRRRLLAHLARYKTARLGVRENGVWSRNGRPYSHILPEGLKRLNILETIRTEFWDYVKDHPELQLHSDFHHLNSSQAMCFNLFFPLFGLPGANGGALLRSLGLPQGPVKDWAFEHVFNIEEGTHFDFLLTGRSGRTVLFEVKLSESAFGNATPDERHHKKLDTIYRPALAGKVVPECLRAGKFFRHYQLFRNVAYADAEGRAHVVLLVPRQNDLLRREVGLLDALLQPGIRRVVHVLWLEDLVTAIRSAARFGVLAAHFGMFEEKYVIRQVGN